MNLAKISSNGQITVPVEIRRLLGLRSGDKLLFFQNKDGEVVVSNASAAAIRKAQALGHKVFLCTGRNPDMLSPVLAYGLSASCGYEAQKRRKHR